MKKIKVVNSSASAIAIRVSDDKILRIDPGQQQTIEYDEHLYKNLVKAIGATFLPIVVEVVEVKEREIKLPQKPAKPTKASKGNKAKTNTEQNETKKSQNEKKAKEEQEK